MNLLYHCVRKLNKANYYFCIKKIDIWFMLMLLPIVHLYNIHHLNV